MGSTTSVTQQSRISATETSPPFRLHKRITGEEVRAVVAWQRDLLAALRESRDGHLQAYHRALSFILTHGLADPRADAAADAHELHEARYQDLDRRILIAKARFATLLPLFRARQNAGAPNPKPNGHALAQGWEL